MDVTDVSLFKDGTYPHCDQRVLHVPGSCVACDEYGSKAQKHRIENRIDFTGYQGIGTAPCPSDAARGLGGAHVWHGNAPKAAKEEASSAFYDRLSREIEQAMSDVARAQNIYLSPSTYKFKYPKELVEASAACDPGDEHVAIPAEGVRIPLAIDWGTDNGTVESVVKVRPCYACDAGTTAMRNGVPVCVKCAT